MDIQKVGPGTNIIQGWTNTLHERCQNNPLLSPTKTGRLVCGEPELELVLANDGKVDFPYTQPIEIDSASGQIIIRI